MYTTRPPYRTCSNCPKTNPIQTLVVKVDYPDRQDLPALFQDTAQIVAQGHDLILVWGQGSSLLSEESGRHTSPAQVVSRLQSLGVNAIGLSGQDGRLIQARPTVDGSCGDQADGRAITTVDFWEIERVNMGLLCLLSGAGYTLVIKATALGPQGELVAVDSDLAAISIAVAVRADTLLVLAGPEAYRPTAMNPSTNIGRYARLSQEAVVLKERLKGGLKDIILSEGTTSFPISNALWGHDSALPISGINTLWMQSSLAT